MRQKVLLFLMVFLCIVLISGCNSVENQAEPTITNTPFLPVSATPVVTPTIILPSFTPAIPTATWTMTPTVIPAVVQVNRFYVQFNQYTQIDLVMNTQAGLYYGTGLSSAGVTINFNCSFKLAPSTDLVCKGDSIPVGASVDFSLLSSATGETLYKNVFTYRGAVPTPTGMSCEVEPQWNGRIPDHQLDVGCFALTCYQNGSFFYGNNNTCEIPWPFDWDFFHPLHPPRQ